MFRHVYVIFFLVFKATVTGITEEVENRFLSFLQTSKSSKTVVGNLGTTKHNYSRNTHLICFKTHPWGAGLFYFLAIQQKSGTIKKKLNLKRANSIYKISSQGPNKDLVYYLSRSKGTYLRFLRKRKKKRLTKDITILEY